MEIKKTLVQIPLTWLHVWLLFAGIYGFAAGFLELTGREAMYFCAISLLMLIPAAASWILIRKTKALWQFLLGGIAVCAVTYLAAKFFCSLFSVQAAAVIEAAAAANDGKNKFENGISPAFLESLSGVMTGLMAAVIFLIRGYMNSVPKELDEAAKIDGCTFFQTFYKIILPVLKPILATVALLSFRGGWNEYILPLVFTMTDASKRPLTVGVTMLKNAGDGAAAWNIMFAGATIAIVPILVIYIFASKYFINGMTAGAVKG